MGQRSEESRQKRRSFSDEFKADAVEIVRTSDKPVAQVARELGVGESTLGYWVKRDRVDRGEKEGVTTSERAELAELRRDNTRLRMERDLLKRAVAFWVKETE
ncbi:MAG: transposase [Acidimicrobiia bacterium]